MKWRPDLVKSAQQTADNFSRFHLCEVLTTMYRPEMGEVSDVVQFVGDDCEAGCLLQIELRATNQIARRQEMLKSLAN